MASFSSNRAVAQNPVALPRPLDRNLAGGQAPEDDYDKDAFAALKETLSAYGLESLTQFAYDALVDGKSEAEIIRDLRTTPEFAARFPAIIERQKAGLPAISPSEYIAYERQAGQLMRAAGLPQGFYDSPSDFTKVLAGDTSLAELQQRIELARDAAYRAPKETTDALRSLYGLSDGDLTAIWLDPDVAQPLLEQRFNAAQIAGTATRTGFGNLAASEAEALVRQGVTDSQAAEGFGTLASSRELFGTMPGEADGTITRAEQIGAAFSNDAAAKTRIEAKKRKREAEFSGGGSVLDSQQGVTGLQETSRR